MWKNVTYLFGDGGRSLHDGRHIAIGSILICNSFSPSSQSKSLDFRLVFHELALHNALDVRLSNKFVKITSNFPNDVWDTRSEEYDN